MIFWLTGFLFASWATRVPNVRDILDASTSQMGLLILGLAAGSVLGLFASSHVIARLGATATILLCLSLASAGLVVVGVVATFAPGLVLLFVALATVGVGYSITDVAMNLSGAANERQIGRTLMPMFHASFSLGTMLGAGFGALTEHFERTDRGAPGRGRSGRDGDDPDRRPVPAAGRARGHRGAGGVDVRPGGVRLDGRPAHRRTVPGRLALPDGRVARSADPADRTDRARDGVRRGQCERLAESVHGGRLRHHQRRRRGRLRGVRHRHDRRPGARRPDPGPVRSSRWSCAAPRCWPSPACCW